MWVLELNNRPAVVEVIGAWLNRAEAGPKTTVASHRLQIHSLTISFFIPDTWNIRYYGTAQPTGYGLLGFFEPSLYQPLLNLTHPQLKSTHCAQEYLSSDALL